VVTWPGKPSVITPPQVHMQVHVLFRAGMLPIMQVAEPGVQGDVVTGMQGIGVNTPRAAAVAEATVGLAIDMHIPKGGMLVIGTKSMMFAAGDVHGQNIKRGWRHSEGAHHDGAGSNLGRHLKRKLMVDSDT
jgi:hypothetical protein